MSLIQSTMSLIQSRPLDLYLSLQNHLNLENVDAVDEVSRNVSEDDLVMFDTGYEHLLPQKTIEYIKFLRDRVNNIYAFEPLSTLQQQYDAEAAADDDDDDDVTDLITVLCFDQEEYNNEDTSKHLFAQNLVEYLNDDSDVVKAGLLCNIPFETYEVLCDLILDSIDKKSTKAKIMKLLKLL